jgi:hypothetical protein
MLIIGNSPVQGHPSRCVKHRQKFILFFNSPVILRKRKKKKRGNEFQKTKQLLHFKKQNARQSELFIFWNAQSFLEDRFHFITCPPETTKWKNSAWGALGGDKVPMQRLRTWQQDMIPFLKTENGAMSRSSVHIPCLGLIHSILESVPFCRLR